MRLLKYFIELFTPKISFYLGPLAAIGIGAGIGGLGSFLGGREARKGAEAAAEASKFRQFDITGPSGSTSFGPTAEQQARIDAITRNIQEEVGPVRGGLGGAPRAAVLQTKLQEALGAEGLLGLENQINVDLDPRLQVIRDQLLGTGEGFLSAAQDFDPDTAALNVTERLRRLAEPKESRDRFALENRLFRQGLLTSTEGAQNLQALFTAQGLADEQRQARAFGLAQDVQDSLLNRGLAGIGGATQLEQLPLSLLDRALSAGGATALAGANAGRFQFLDAQNRGDALSGFFNTLGGGIAQGLTTRSNINADLEADIFSNPGLF